MNFGDELFYYVKELVRMLQADILKHGGQGPGCQFKTLSLKTLVSMLPIECSIKADLSVIAEEETRSLYLFIYGNNMSQPLLERAAGVLADLKGDDKDLEKDMKELAEDEGFTYADQSIIILGFNMVLFDRRVFDHEFNHLVQEFISTDIADGEDGSAIDEKKLDVLSSKLFDIDRLKWIFSRREFWNIVKVDLRYGLEEIWKKLYGKELSWQEFIEKKVERDVKSDNWHVLFMFSPIYNDWIKVWRNNEVSRDYLKALFALRIIGENSILDEVFKRLK